MGRQRKNCDNKRDKWKEMVSQSAQRIEDFNALIDDKAIEWANEELKSYKRAVKLLSNVNGGISKEDEKFITTMKRRAKAN